MIIARRVDGLLKKKGNLIQEISVDYVLNLRVYIDTKAILQHNFKI